MLMNGKSGIFKVKVKCLTNKVGFDMGSIYDGYKNEELFNGQETVSVIDKFGEEYLYRAEEFEIVEWLEKIR